MVSLAGFADTEIALLKADCKAKVEGARGADKETIRKLWLGICDLQDQLLGIVRPPPVPGDMKDVRNFPPGEVSFDA